MEAEYVALRSEIVAWQQRRITVLIGTGALVGSVLGIFSKPDTASSWPIVSSLLLVFLGAAAIVSSYAADVVNRISAYVAANFEDAHWERDMLDSPRLFIGNVNRALATVYGAMAAAAITVPASSSSGNYSAFDFVVLAASSIFYFASTLWMLFGARHQRPQYRTWYASRVAQRRTGGS